MPVITEKQRTEAIDKIEDRIQQAADAYLLSDAEAGVEIRALYSLYWMLRDCYKKA